MGTVCPEKKQKTVKIVLSCSHLASDLRALWWKRLYSVLMYSVLRSHDTFLLWCRDLRIVLNYLINPLFPILFLGKLPCNQKWDCLLLMHDFSVSLQHKMHFFHFFCTLLHFLITGYYFKKHEIKLQYIKFARAFHFGNIWKSAEDTKVTLID